MKASRGQTIDLYLDGVLRLPVGERSPYFPTSRRAVKNNSMAVNKAFVWALAGLNTTARTSVQFWDNDTVVENTAVNMDMTGVNSLPLLKDASVTAVLNYASAQGYTAISSASDLIWVLDPARAQVRTVSYPSLAVNTSRQASTTQDAQVSASVDITATLSLSGGQSGKVELKYADDTGFTTNVRTVQQGSNGNTGSLTIGLNITQLGTATLTGVVPAGKYYRLVTTNVTGSPTFGTPLIQEVLI